MTHAHPVAAGKSSYDLIDSEKFWQFLAIPSGITALDLACGAGRYTLPLAERVGPRGKVIAVDLWADGIAQLRTEARRRKMNNVETHVADAGQALPLRRSKHRSLSDGHGAARLRAGRHGGRRPPCGSWPGCSNPRGLWSWLSSKKSRPPHGPPHPIRLSVEDLAVMVQRLRFIRFSGVVDLGPDLYAARFRRLGTQSL